MSTRFAYRISLALLILLTTGPMAQAVNWTGANSTDWFDGGNWNNALTPIGSTDLFIHTANGNDPLIAAGAAVAGIVNVGNVLGSGILNITGGTLQVGGVTATDDMNLAQIVAGANSGTVNHTGGTVNLPDSLFIGQSANPSSFGLYTLDGGTLAFAGAASQIGLQYNSTFDYQAGTITGLQNLLVGTFGVGNAVINLNGNTITTINDVQLSNFAAGRTGTDAINLQGGTLNVGNLPRATGNNVSDDFLFGGNTGAGTTFTVGVGETVDIGDNLYMGDPNNSKPILNINAGSTFSIGGDWTIARHATDTNADIVNINDASGFVMTELEGLGNVSIEGEAVFNMNDPVNTLFLPTAFNVGVQNTGVSILNMAANTTIDVDTSMNLGLANTPGNTDVDQINMGAGSLLTLGTSFNVSGWDGGGTVTHAAGTIDAGTTVTIGGDVVSGIEVTWNQTGGTLRSASTMNFATGLQPGDTTVDRLNQSGGLIETGFGGTPADFNFSATGRAVISGDATFAVARDLVIGAGIDPTAVTRFTAEGNSTINIDDDIHLGTTAVHGESTFTISDNADVNVGSGSGIGDFNIAEKGTVNIQGGTLDIEDRFNIGSVTELLFDTQRTVNQSGGAVTVGGFMDLATTNANVNGVYNLTGGTLQIGTLATDALDLTSTSTGTVEFNLDGGILNVTRINDQAGNGLFNWGAGTLSPGFEGTAALTAYMGNLVMTSESKLTMDILTADVAGLPNDLLTVSGDLFFDGKIELNELLGEFNGIPGRYIIATYGGTLTLGAPELVNENALSIFDFMTPGEIAVLFVPPPVPEPSTMTLLGLGLLGLLRRSRRRRK